MNDTPEEREKKAQEIINSIKTESKEETMEQRIKNIESIVSTIRIQNIKIWEKLNGKK